jgi:hypothetical protein
MSTMGWNAIVNSGNATSDRQALQRIDLEFMR